MSILFNGSYTNTNQQLWANYEPSVKVALTLSNVTASSSVTLSNLKPYNTYEIRFNMFFIVSNSVTFSNLIDGTNQYSLAVNNTPVPLELIGVVGSSIGLFTDTVPLVPSSPYFKIGDSGSSAYFTNTIRLTPQSSSLVFSFLNLSPTPSVATNLFNCFGTIAIQNAS